MHAQGGDLKANGLLPLLATPHVCARGRLSADLSSINYQKEDDKAVIYASYLWSVMVV